MLGGGVEELWRTDPVAPIEGIRPVTRGADLAVANLESPLTDRPHQLGLDALEAPRAAASVLTAAGFDAMAVANNHAADAGPGTVADTVGALEAAGVVAVGRSVREGAEVVERDGVEVALLAFHVGPDVPGIAGWDPAAARAAVRDARLEADVVLTSIHGGIPYWRHPGRGFAAVARRLARAGADVVWGHGPHVAHPVRIVEHDGRTSVIATSLGNLVFDPQGAPGTDRGLLLEVRATDQGVVAYRVGDVELSANRSRFTGWRPPLGEAVGFEGAWWNPLVAVIPVPVAAAGRPLLTRLDPTWRVERALRGDVDGDGRAETVVLFRDPYVRREIHAAFVRPPGDLLIDAHGRVVRLAVYDAGLRPRWIASLVARPISDLAVCDGSLAVSYRRLDHPGVTGTGLWRWDLFGFVSFPSLDGPGEPGCADVDRDGLTEPVITRREPP
jgi:hypothetical protein